MINNTTTKNIVIQPSIPRSTSIYSSILDKSSSIEYQQPTSLASDFNIVSGNLGSTVSTVSSSNLISNFDVMANKLFRMPKSMSSNNIKSSNTQNVGNGGLNYHQSIKRKHLDHHI